VLLEIGLFVVLAITLFLARNHVNDYVGFPATGYIVGMLAVTLAYNVVTATLNGQHLVHLAGVTSPLKTGSRAGIQIAALAAGLGLAGLFGGYILGYLVVTILGGVVVVRSLNKFSTPGWRHFQDLYSYAKYAWIGGLRSKAFNWVDIAVLGFFVSSSFIGFYTAAWNIAQFLIIFGSSVSQTLFPEMSKLSAADDPDAVAELLDTGLSYAGLFLIPGLIGGTLLAERILRIYGPEFVEAELVLSILIVATLVQAYQKQITTTLNAIDRPDLSFRVNVVFIGTNVVLNVVLIYLLGWIGAAVATASSVAISLVVGYYYLSTEINFSVPIVEHSKQWVAGGLMGAFVLGGLWFEEAYVNLGHNFGLVLSLIATGALVYFLVLFGLSARFRLTVIDNLPSIPL
jgi:O-antigen/teichoic acid export membrane protein